MGATVDSDKYQAARDSGLSAKTIKNYFGVFTQVIASAKNDKGEELYPYKWDPAFLDLGQEMDFGLLARLRQPTHACDVEVCEVFDQLFLQRAVASYAIY
jgi:hypothetical protein